jgi:uncharacterized protein (DUF433 family)
MTLPDFLTSDADDEIRIAGHRIRLIDVAQRYQEGFSVEGIVDYYPTLSLPLVHKAIAYFLENEPDVLARVDARRADMVQLQTNAGPATPSLIELRARFANKSRTASSEAKAV